MKLTVDQKVLAPAVAHVAKLAKDDTTIAIWGCVLLEARPDGLRVRAYNGEQATSRDVRATVSDPGAIAIRAADFAALTKGLPKTGFELFDQDGFLHVRGARTKYRLAALSPDDFPAHPEHGARSSSATIKATELSRLLASVAHAMSRDAGRPHLFGVRLESDGKAGRLVAAATDGARLAVNAIAISDKFSAGVIVPRGAVGAFRELLDGAAGDADVVLTVSDRLVSLTAGSDGGQVVVATRMADARFPPWEKVIPTGTATLELQVDGPELVAAISRMSLVSAISRMSIVRKGTDGRAVRLTFVPPDVLRVEADNPDVGDGSDEVAAAVVSGTPDGFGPMGIEARYMTEAVGSFADAEISLHLFDPLTALKIDTGGELVQVVMPMRL